MYCVRDKVWLSGQNIRTSQPGKKLDYKYHGLFMILGFDGIQPYQLNLLKALQNIHNIFPHSLLHSSRIIRLMIVHSHFPP